MCDCTYETYNFTSIIICEFVCCASVNNNNNIINNDNNNNRNNYDLNSWNLNLQGENVFVLDFK